MTPALVQKARTFLSDMVNRLAASFATSTLGCETGFLWVVRCTTGANGTPGSDWMVDLQTRIDAQPARGRALRHDGVRDFPGLAD